MSEYILDALKDRPFPRSWAEANAFMPSGQVSAEEDEPMAYLRQGMCRGDDPVVTRLAAEPEDTYVVYVGGATILYYSDETFSVDVSRYLTFPINVARRLDQYGPREWSFYSQLGLVLLYHHEADMGGVASDGERFPVFPLAEPKPLGPLRRVGKRKLLRIKKK